MAALQFAGGGGTGVRGRGGQREQERSESLERGLKELEGTKGVGGRKEKVCGERYARLKDISLNFSTLSA